MTKRRWTILLAVLFGLFIAGCGARSPRLEGILRDAVSGGAIADAQVHVAEFIVPADRDGRFEVELPTGEHQGRVVAEGYVDAPVVVRLSEETRRQTVEITMQPRTLRGKAVVADTGEALGDGQIQYGDLVQPLGPDGSFELQARELNDLLVSCEGCIPITMSAAEIAASFAVDGSQSAPVTIQVNPRTVEGVVREPDGAPVEGAQVRLGTQSAMTDADGHYQLRFVQEGLELEISSTAHRPIDPVATAGQETLEVTLEPWEATVLVRDEASENPLANALVSAAQAEAITDADGLATLRAAPDSELIVSAEGYSTVTLSYEGDAAPLEASLRPIRVFGTLTNQEDGAPVRNALVQVFRQGADTPELLRTDEQGAYDITDAQDVTRLFIKAPGYRRVDLPVTQMGRVDVELEVFDSRGIYITLGILSLPDRFYELLDLVENSDVLNTVVIDVKGDWATMAYPSQVPLAQEIGTAVPGLMDIEEVLEACRDRDIYTIARIVVFKDRLLASARPEWAIDTHSGGLYRDGEGLNWMDPFREEVWDYNIAIMLEAVDKGFDEIQLDYIRFPSEGRVSDRIYIEEATFESRTRAIREFSAASYRAMEPTPAFLSADIFGLTPWVNPDLDMGIGQRIEDFAPYMDYLSPMLYPTTFNRIGLRSAGIQDAWLAPYDTVYESLVRLLDRTDTKVRPWLQHYSVGVPYRMEEFLVQRKAAEDAGSHGWLFWHSAGRYHEEIFTADPYHLLRTIPQPPVREPQE